jgi:hypothetical protein
MCLSLRLLIVLEAAKSRASCQKARSPGRTATQRNRPEKQSGRFILNLLMFLRFEGTSQKGAIASPYAHAGLAAGEASSGALGKENHDILLVFITFREHVQKTQKSLRGLR